MADIWKVVLALAVLGTAIWLHNQPEVNVVMNAPEPSVAVTWVEPYPWETPEWIPVTYYDSVYTGYIDWSVPDDR